MKVVSDTTLVVKRPEGIIEYAPGTVVEYSKEKAEELVTRGLARAYVPSAPAEGAASDPEPEKPPKPEKPQKA